MAMVLQISDGSVTVDFTGSNYKVLSRGWAPQRAQRRRGLMGGSPYTDVAETLRIQVKGTTQADCLAQLDKLSDLLEQAELWNEGGSVDDVYIQYAPDGSSLGAASTAIIKGPAQGRPMLTMPNNFEFHLQGGRNVLGLISDPIILTFVRLGEWLGATEAKSSSESTDNPAKLAAATYTTATSIAVPHDIKIKFNRASGTDPNDEIYALIQNKADKLYLVEAEDLTYSASGGSWTVGGFSIAAASGGKVGRYTFSGALQSGEATDSSPGIDSSARTMAFYCVADNDTGSDLVFQMQMRCGGSGGLTVTGRRVVIDSANSSPQPYHLGTITVPAAIAEIEFNLNAVGSGSVSGTVDIDHICGIVLDSNAHIIKLNDALDDNTDVDIYLEHRADSDLSAFVYETNSGSGTAVNYPSYEGNPGVYMSGGSVHALVFGNTDTTAWVIEDGSGGKADLTLTATQTLAYLTPV